METQQIVEARLAEAGIKLSEEDVAQLVAVYPKLQAWRGIVQSMLVQESEPAVTFSGVKRGAL